MPSSPSRALTQAFEAFYARNHQRYLAYAQAHLDQRTAAEAVRTTFTDLTTHWDAIVSSTNPTATAWDRLSHEVRSRTQPAPSPAPPASRLRDDVRVLAALGYTPEASADLTGRDATRVRCLTSGHGTR